MRREHVISANCIESGALWIQSVEVIADGHEVSLNQPLHQDKLNTLTSSPSASWRKLLRILIFLVARLSYIRSDSMLWNTSIKPSPRSVTEVLVNDSSSCFMAISLTRSVKYSVLTSFLTARENCVC